jgi:hypothetical protein
MSPLLARASVRGRIAVVKDELAPVGVLEARLMADPGVEDVALKLDPPRLKLGAGGGHLVDPKRDSGGGTELGAERLGLYHGKREGAGLEFASRSLPQGFENLSPRTSP